MKKLFFAFLFIPSFLFSQSNTSKGIYFETAPSWEQICTKAKAENKYIFLDCFATWCGPCKVMDKNVYPDSTVGQFMNEKFICVKVQMDKTEFDDENVKKWYSEAAEMEKGFAISAFPTYLFFSPDGKPMHKEVGYKNQSEFITIAKDALDSTKQYYAILANYNPGKFDATELKALARTYKLSGKMLACTMAVEYFSKIPKSEWSIKDNCLLMSEFNDCAEMQTIASHYVNRFSKIDFKSDNNLLVIKNFKQVEQMQCIVFEFLESLKFGELKEYTSLLNIFKEKDKTKNIVDHYINSLSQSELYSKNNLLLLKNFTKYSGDKGFNIFRIDGDSVDSILDIKGLSKYVVSTVINNEEIQPYWNEAVKKGEAPWKKISRSVEKKYSKGIADEIVLNAKVTLYQYYTEKHNKNWAEYIKYYIRQIERYGTDTTSGFEDATRLNNFVFRVIFYHSTKKKDICTGLRWMEGVIRRNPKDANHLDTYANLLYKAGKKQEAIRWQERAVKLAIDEKQNWAVRSLQANLEKMKRDQPTWIKDTKN